jgi:15-cis-phytoene synthase
MNISQTYIKEKIPDGSSLYYSLRHIPINKRSLVQAIYCWYLNIEDTLNLQSELQIIEQKFAWWQAECSVLFHGQPQHPVSQLISTHVARYNLQEQHFQQILHALKSNIETVHYQNYASIEQYCQNTLVKLIIILAEILIERPLNQNERTSLTLLGTAMQQYRFIRHLKQDLHRGHIYLPEEALIEFNLTASQLLNLSQTPSELKALLSTQYKTIATQFHTAAKLLPRKTRNQLSSLFCLAYLNNKTLHIMQDDGYQVFQHKLQLTPIRKLLLSEYYRWRL